MNNNLYRWQELTNDNYPKGEEFEAIDILTLGWDNNYVASYHDYKFYSKDKNDEDGNPKEITEHITHWMYILPLEELPPSTETPEQVLSRSGYIEEAIVGQRKVRYCEIETAIKAMEIYASQFKGIVSEEENNIYREQGWEAGRARLKHEYFTGQRTPEEWQMDENKAPDKQKFLSSFLTKKP